MNPQVAETIGCQSRRNRDSCDAPPLKSKQPSDKIYSMSVKEIEHVITQLPKEELAEFEIDD